jgi:hypothetical protein
MTAETRLDGSSSCGARAKVSTQFRSLRPPSFSAFDIFVSFGLRSIVLSAAFSGANGWLQILR